MASVHGCTDPVLAFAEKYIREFAAGLETEGLYILSSKAQLEDRGVANTANRINSELEARMISYVADKIHRGLEMTETAVIAHLSAPSGRNTRLKTYIETNIRGTSKSNASSKAAANLNDGFGPFQGYDCSDDLTKEVRDEAIAQIEEMVRDGKVKGVSRKQAEAAIVRILEQHGLEYVHFLTLPQLRALVDRYVRYQHPSRPDGWWKIGSDSSSALESGAASDSSSTAASSGGTSVEDLSSECSASTLDVDENDCGSSAVGPSSHGPLHQTVKDEVLNETVAMTDTLVHMKATINQSIAMLEKGKAITLDLFDESFGKNAADDSNSEEMDGDFMEDIYVMAPEEFAHQMCQGQSKRLFDDYKAFDDHTKTLERNRYLVGMFHARVFDCNSKFSMPRSGEGGGDGIPITPNQNAKSQIFREIAYSPDTRYPGTLQVSPYDTTRDSDHTFFLHRFVALVANHHGINIFGEGVLSDLGIEFAEGNKYDHHFAYRPLRSNDEARTIARALRVGDAHSRQCDVDHRRGRDKRWLHGILFAHPTSHRMNTCLVHCRVNAKHWCFGLEIYPYKGGVESTERTGTALPKDLVFPKWKQVLKEGNTFDGAKQLRKLDIVPVTPLRDLVPIKPEDVGLDDVDCECSSLKKGQTKCHVCRMNEQENEKQSKKKQSAKKRKSDASSAAPGGAVMTRSGRVSKKLVP